MIIPYRTVRTGFFKLLEHWPTLLIRATHAHVKEWAGDGRTRIAKKRHLGSAA
jgi:hypothetical protein